MKLQSSPRSSDQQPPASQNGTEGTHHNLPVLSPDGLRVAYLLKMYPRFSETFIVNEILAHEAAGTNIDIYSLRAPTDGRFHTLYAQVQAKVHFVPNDEMRHTVYWRALQKAAAQYPALWSALHQNVHLDAREIIQAIWLADAFSQPDQRPHCIHAHFGTTSTSVAWLVSQLTGIPYIFTAHAKDIFHEDVVADDLRRKVRDAHRVITVSDYNVNYLQAQIGVSPSQVVRIFNGLDLRQFPYELPVDRPRRVVAVGRLVEKKGFDVLVNACAALAAEGNPIPCEIIGAGPQEADLKAQIEAKGVSQWVTLRGPQPQHVVKTAVQEAAAFIAPCVVGEDGNRDGLPTVLLEAMALGTPVVSTDVTGIPEILVHEQTGLMVAQHDAEGLAAAMRRLVEDEALRVQLSQAARSRIEADFAIDRNAAQIRGLYASARSQHNDVAPKPTSKSRSAQPATLHTALPDLAEVRS